MKIKSATLRKLGYACAPLLMLSLSNPAFASTAPNTQKHKQTHPTKPTPKVNHTNLIAVILGEH